MTTTPDPAPAPTARSARPRRLRRSAAALLAGTALALAVSGCGSSDDAATTSTATAAAAASDDAVGAAKAAVEQGRADVRSGVPASSPAPARDKFVVLIPCSAAVEGCAQPIQGAADAAKALGWRTRTIDGKGSPADQAAAIEQAVALKPDGIVIHAIDPEAVKGAVLSARKAGIPVAASSALPSELVAFSSSPSPETFRQVGALGADYIVAKTEGKAKVLQLTNNEFGVLKPRTAGFDEQLAKCADCEVVAKASFVLADLASKLPQVVQQLVQKHPDADVIYAPFDDVVPFVLQGLKSAGRDDLLVVSGDGTAQTLECLRTACGQDATVALPVTWIGWTDIDALNRIFNDEDPDVAAEGLPVKLVDADNVQSEPGAWEGDVDFAAEYRRLWASATR